VLPRVGMNRQCRFIGAVHRPPLVVRASCPVGVRELASNVHRVFLHSGGHPQLNSLTASLNSVVRLHLHLDYVYFVILLHSG